MLDQKLADNIRNLRKSKGFSQNQLAEMLGVAQKTISAYESAVMKPSIESLISLSELFEVGVEELLGLRKTAVSKSLKSGPIIRRLKTLEKLSEKDRKYMLKTIDVLLKGLKR